jgi:hypothetical protein
MEEGLPLNLLLHLAKSQAAFSSTMQAAVKTMQAKLR